MPTPIAPGPLRILRRIYQLAGGITVADRLDEKSPIQLVHDVSREVEIGFPTTRDSGFFLMQFQATHAAPGTITTNVNVYTSALPALEPGLEPEEMDVWLLRAWGTTSNSVNFTSASMALSWPPGDSYPGEAYANLSFLPLITWKGNAQFYTTAGNKYLLTNGTNTMFRGVDYNFPFRAPPGSSVSWTSVVANACTVTYSMLCWAGVRGAEPPRGW